MSAESNETRWTEEPRKPVDCPIAYLKSTHDVTARNSDDESAQCFQADVPVESIPLPQLLRLAQQYLARRGPGDKELEAAWNTFHEHCSRRICRFAFSCGATEQDIADCVQDVWSELLARLPKFRLDPARGQFDTWLYHIVRSKVADQRRARRHRARHETRDAVQLLPDGQPSPFRSLENSELVRLVYQQLQDRLSGSNLELFTLRLVEDCPVAEVAKQLGLSHEQVWYRLHRVRREAEQIGAALANDEAAVVRAGRSKVRMDSLSARISASPFGPQEKTENPQESAQGNSAVSVSRDAPPGSIARHGGACVDYLFQKLELGRRELMPEWKVEWNCDEAMPRPQLFIRKLALVAYAEMCVCEDFAKENWPRIARAALAAGVSAGIATIIATPSAVLPIFRTEFYKQLHGKTACPADDTIHVALSARQEAHGPWSACKC